MGENLRKYCGCENGCNRAVEYQFVIEASIMSSLVLFLENGWYCSPPPATVTDALASQVYAFQL